MANIIEKIGSAIYFQVLKLVACVLLQVNYPWEMHRSISIPTAMNKYRVMQSNLPI